MTKLNPMVFVLEGVDNAGKTYLMEYIAKEIPGMVVKFSIRPKSSAKSEQATAKNYWWAWINFMKDNPDKMFWMDRFYMSEMVYSFVKRGYDASTDPEMKELEKELKSMPHLLVYCYPGRDELISRYKKNGDEHIQIDDLEPLLDRYDQFLKTTTLNTLTVDTKLKPEEVGKLIIAKVKELYEHK